MTDSPRRDGSEPTQSFGSGYPVDYPDPAYSNQPPYQGAYPAVPGPAPQAAPNPTQQLPPYSPYGHDAGATGQPPVYSANWGAGARVEYKFFGDWANYKDFTAKTDKVDLLVAGAGTSYTERDPNNTLLNTVDLQFENTAGLGLYGAVIGDFTDLNDGTGNGDRFDWGALVQAGYLLNPNWEVFGRYDVTILDDDFAVDNDVFNEFTVGVNYYAGKEGSALHRAKVTVDVVYLPDGSPSSQPGLGITAGEEDQFILRGQFQLVL